MIGYNPPAVGEGFLFSLLSFLFAALTSHLRRNEHGLLCGFNGFLWKEIALTRRLTDPREKPRIRLETIAGSVMLLPLAGARSLLSIDQMMRSDARRYFDESVSDTHLTRVIRDLNPDELRAINRRVCDKSPNVFRMQSGRALRIGLVDGTTMNKVLVSAFSRFETMRTGISSIWNHPPAKGTSWRPRRRSSIVWWATVRRSPGISSALTGST